MHLSRKELRNVILTELEKVSTSNQGDIVELCKQIQKAADTAGMLFEDEGDDMLQTIEMILTNLREICDAKRDGKVLSGDPKTALLKHVNAIAQDVD